MCTPNPGVSTNLSLIVIHSNPRPIFTLVNSFQSFKDYSILQSYLKTTQSWILWSDTWSNTWGIFQHYLNFWNSILPAINSFDIPGNFAIHSTIWGKNCNSFLQSLGPSGPINPIVVCSCIYSFLGRWTWICIPVYAFRSISMKMNVWANNNRNYPNECMSFSGVRLWSMN